MNNSDSHLEGAIAVRAALIADSRPVESIWISENRLDSEIAFLEQLAAQRAIPIRRVRPDKIDALAEGRTHGGVIARVGARCFLALEDLLPDQEAPFIAMLDGVEDPYNFGQAVRALYAAGCHGVVVQPRNWLAAAATVARASAGASEMMPMAVAENAEAAARSFAARGLTIATTSDSEGTSIFTSDLTVPLFLLIGGEKRGVSSSFSRLAQMCLMIPYGRPFDLAIGTATAAAVLAFEIMRQRQDVL